MTREDIIEFVSEDREILKRIVESAELEEISFGFPLSKTAIANIRHDAMMDTASQLLDVRWRKCPNARSGMWVGPKYVARFKKIEADGRTGGYRTATALALKMNKQLALFSDCDPNIRIVNVGYCCDDTGAIVDFLISYYFDGKPHVVLSLDELFEDLSAPIQLPIVQVDRPRTIVKLRTVETEDESS